MAEQNDESKGAALRARLIGVKHVAEESGLPNQPTCMQAFQKVSTEIIFGTLWSRPGLDFKTRSLICVVSDVAAGRVVLPEHSGSGECSVLAVHLRMALRQGWTVAELTEVLVQLLGYVGAPLIRDAMIVASKVFEEASRGSQID